MSNFSFRPAKRENVGLLIGLAGGTGSGKTFSAMLMAQGLAAGERFAVIDTESGRAKHYADQFHFDHGDLSAPFRPSSYVEAIQAADKAGYPVIVVDSMSHEHAGDGGLLDYHEDELTRMAGDDYRKRESCKMAAWIKPKTDHKRMVSKILQLRAHVIFCFRAEEKIEMTREDGRMKIVKKKTATGLDGWVPVCEKTLPYEMTMSFLLMADRPGIPQPIKLQEQHRKMIDLSRPIGVEFGQSLSAWASGGSDKPKMQSDEAEDNRSALKVLAAKIKAIGISRKEVTELSDRLFGKTDSTSLTVSEITDLMDEIDLVMAQ